MNDGNPAKNRGILFPGDQRLKIITVFALIIFVVSVPSGRYSALLVYLLIVAAWMISSGVRFQEYVRRLLLVLPFIILAASGLIWSMLIQGGDNLPGKIPPGDMALSAILKSSISIMAVSALVISAGFAELLKGFERLKFPAILTQLIMLTWKYIEITGGEARRMSRAMQSRLYNGKWIWHAGMTGRMLGALLLRSYERGERIHNAMLSRGYSGRVAIANPEPVKAVDAIITLTIILVLFTVRFFPELLNHATCN